MPRRTSHYSLRSIWNLLSRIKRRAFIFAVCAQVVFPFFSAQAQAAPPREVRHGTIPGNPDYWKFNKWYVDHVVVDVYANGERPDHLAAVLQEIAVLQKRDIVIRDIVIIGGNSFAQLDSNTRASVLAIKDSPETREALKMMGTSPLIGKLAEELNLGEGMAVPDVEAKVSAAKLAVSPAWIVTYHGRQRNYEGEISLSRRFSRAGDIKRTEESDRSGRESQSVKLLPAPAQSDVPAYVQAFRYTIGKQRMPPGLGTYDVKPPCTAANRRKNPVYYDSKELDDFDMTFYDYKDPPQAARAKNLNRPAVPYLEGDLFNPHREQGNLQQQFARFFDVKCLPTRIHYAYEGDQRIEIYAEGPAAWE